MRVSRVQPWRVRWPWRRTPAVLAWRYLGSRVGVRAPWRAVGLLRVRAVRAGVTSRRLRSRASV